MKIKETDIAKALIDSFKGTEYEIFQEVESYIGIADIVLRHANFTWAVECKTSLSLQVIAQAWENKRAYNFSSICVPTVRRSKGSSFAHELCQRYGIGIFKVSGMYSHDGSFSTTEALKARFNRNISKNAVNLVEQHKTYAAAGNANGDRWTPFNNTVSELKNYIRKYPGCKLKDALANTKHHYASISSAQNSIRQWVNSGVIKGIEIDRGILTLVDE